MSNRIISNQNAEEVIVVKHDASGKEVWRYGGQVLRRSDHQVLLQAEFARQAQFAGSLLLEPGDRFVEAYFSDRWYNIYEIYAHGDGRLKGWYCNVSLPARFEGEFIHYTDLALDLVVLPGGEQQVLDEDEFAELHLNADRQDSALGGLRELQELFKARPRLPLLLDQPPRE